MSNQDKQVEQERIREEVEALCQGPAFSTSPKLRRLLRYLVGETLEGRSERLKAYTIAVEGMGRRENFCADTDPYIRNLAVRLRRAIADHYHTGESVSGIRIQFPKGGYVPVFGYTSPGPASKPRPVNAANLPAGGSHTTVQPVLGAPVLLVYVLDEADIDGNPCDLGPILSEQLVIALRRFPTVRIFGPMEKRGAADGQLVANYETVDGDVELTPGILWGPLAHAACFGQTGQRDEAGEALQEVLRLQPQFPQNGNALLEHLIRSAPLRDRVMQGLRGAGLAMTPFGGARLHMAK